MRQPDWPVIGKLALLGAAVACGAWLVLGCATLARLDTLEVNAAAIQVELGQVQVGGGGDSVTAWIYALIAGASVLYPMMWRPARKWWERRAMPA